MPRTAVRPRFDNVGDVLERLGGIDPKRVRADVPFGKATESDLIRLLEGPKRLYELVDGVLVEKIMGVEESFLALYLARLIGNFADEHCLGFLTGEAGAIRTIALQVRMPDIAFISWNRVPVRERIPKEKILSLVPDLAVEVLSEGNTPAEMQRKLKEYFLAGVPLVWFVDPRERTVEVFTAPDQSTVLAESDILSGANVLPGFSLPVKQIFKNIEPETKPSRTRARGKKRKK